MRNRLSKEPWYAVGDPWLLTQSEWDPEKNLHFETIFTQSNGYMGVRGYTEEANAGLKSFREGYLAGVFGEIDEAALKQIRVNYGWRMLAMITLPELFACEIELDGEPFKLSAGKLEFYSRSLNMRNGALTRHVIWVSPTGSRTRLLFERFLSAAQPHLGMQQITLLPENWTGKAVLKFELDGAYPTYFRCGDRSLPHLRQNILQNPKTVLGKNGTGNLTVEVKGTGHKVCIASNIAGGSCVGSAPNSALLRQEVALELRKGESAGVLHAVAVVSSRDGVETSLVRERAGEIAREAVTAGYNSSLDESESVWSRRWTTADVTIDGPARDQAFLRFSSFSMLQMAPFHTDNMSVPARAYAFNRYHGLYYWDSETFLLPYYLHTFPEVAENLLSFRYRTLDGARRNARRLKSTGACYPWMTDSDDGTEQAPWCIGDYVWHQNADIAYAIDRYVQTTGDFEFMSDKGLEILVESARFWMSRLERDKHGVVHLHDTVGPDEIDKHGKDNGYTSLLARHHLRLAVRWIDNIKAADARAGKALIEKLNIGASEIKVWTQAADRMAVPNVPGKTFPLQDEHLLGKKPLDFKGLTADEAYAKRHTHRVIKQSDIILGMFLLQEDFTVEQMREAYDFYEPMTLHYSSLSYNTHSILATKIGRDQQAYDYFLKAAGLDLDDERGTIADGLHAAALGGTWQTVVYGFLGMRHLPEGIAFEPRLPAAWKSISLRIAFRGYQLHLTLAHDVHRLEVEGAKGMSPARVILNGESHLLRDKLSVTSPVNGAELSQRFFEGKNRKRTIKAVIFDLDGVIVSTDEYHFQAWKRLAESEGIPFGRESNDRVRGVSRMESLEVVLEKATKKYTMEQKRRMAERKNDFYRQLLTRVSPAEVLPGVVPVLKGLKERGVKIAIGSSSKNALTILRAVGMGETFDAIADGNHVTRSKPDPQIFNIAAQKLGVAPEECLVVEDAEAGVDAGLAAGMKVLAVGAAIKHPRATIKAKNLAGISVDEMLKPDSNGS